MPKIAFITSILGGYESICRPFAKQTVDTDFICFTDDLNIESNGWIIDTNPYHDTNPSPLDNGLYINSMHKKGRLEVLNNRHTFNIAKYYKQAWKNIPRLEKYDVVIWIDGSIEITDPYVSEYMVELCNKYYVVSWHHEMRGGVLFHEAFSSYLGRYHNSNYLKQWQPYQDIINQYHHYLQEGYDEDYFNNYPRKEGRGRGDHFGMWLTCFVAVNNRSKEMEDFLNLWYLQTLKYSTQDQVGFPKVVQDTGIVPYTLPDTKYPGDEPHIQCSMFIKHEHFLRNQH
jgi:hypothetical protein